MCIHVVYHFPKVTAQNIYYCGQKSEATDTASTVNN